jgi:hypothetical protein
MDDDSSTPNFGLSIELSFFQKRNFNQKKGNLHINTMSPFSRSS